jgi:hypothetical protein
MGYFRKKPVVIEAISFDELVEYGRNNGANIVNGMPWSFQYQGHPITHENDQCYLIPTLEGTLRFTPDDVLITGIKGEIYPCKRDIFEATYELAEPKPMTFGDAVEALKLSKKVARDGWNGKGMFVYYVPKNTYPAQTNVAREYFGDTVDYNPYFAIKNVNDTVSTWVPSINDVLAEDWVIVE